MMDRRGKDDEGGFSRGIADDESLQEKLQPTKGVAVGPADILCGRGKTSFNHGTPSCCVFRLAFGALAVSQTILLPSVGNKLFRNKVSEALPSYIKAENRYEKSLVSHAIVTDILQTGGRFLKQNVSLGIWVELSEQEARDKVGHAVRDAAAAFLNRRKRYRGRRKTPTPKAEEGESDKPPPSSVNLHQALANLSSIRARSLHVNVADTEPLPIDAGNPLPIETGNPSYFETASVALPSDSLSLPDLPSSSSTLSPYVPARQQYRTHGGDPHDHFLAAIDSVLGPLPPGETDPMGRLLERQRQDTTEPRSDSEPRSGSDTSSGFHHPNIRPHHRNH
jgi:hypothetical protein